MRTRYLPVASDPDSDTDLAVVLLHRKNLVAMHAAPRGDVVHRAWIGGDNVEQRTRGEVLDPVLGSNDRQRTDETADVKALIRLRLRVRHATLPESDGPG